MKIFVVVLLFLLCIKMYPQQNDREALAYNVGLGSFFGGVGAIINKSKNEKWHKAFFKGAWKGALGGYIVYEGKKRIYDFSRTEDYKYAWAAKILYSAGNSIIENAASNKDFWYKWNITIGFNRVEFITQGKFKVNYQMLPLALISTIRASSIGKFDFNKSIKTGTFIFTSIKRSNFDRFSEGNLTVTGLTFRNSVVLFDDGSNSFLKELPHEIIHTFQYEDFQNMNTFFIKPKTKYFKDTFLEKLDKFIYFDFNSLPHNFLKSIQNTGNCRFNNFFEQEANFYSERQKCSF